mmetsp:Transcript_103395/g.186557  ORF Transcript_103395/g.186557 Transcript_103395/m.186557 type:complete len:265 (+) Transcript_103395:1009-1803(+)
MARRLDFAKLDLSAITLSRCPAVVRRPDDVSPAPGLSALAARGARGPILPVAPQAVDANVVALSEVARQELLHLVLVADSSGALWHLGDAALSHHGTSSARLRAAGPRAPVIPLAIQVAIWVAASPVLCQREEAAVAPSLAEAGDCARPGLMAWAAAHRAPAPLQPSRNLAVSHSALSHVAALGLHEVRRAETSTVSRELLDLPLTPGLSSTTGPGAFVPGRPRAHVAVNFCAVARLSFVHGTEARQTAKLRSLRQDAVPLSLH